MSEIMKEFKRDEARFGISTFIIKYDKLADETIKMPTFQRAENWAYRNAQLSHVKVISITKI